MRNNILVISGDINGKSLTRIKLSMYLIILEYSVDCVPRGKVNTILSEQPDFRAIVCVTTAKTLLKET